MPIRGFITILLLTHLTSYSQKEKYIGVYSSLVNGGALMQSTVSGFSVNETTSLRFGLTYSTQLGPNLFFMTGTEYAHHNLDVSYDDGTPNAKGVFDLLSFPITLHASWKYLYLTGGLIADFELKNVLFQQSGNKEVMPNQTGLGPTVEFGLKHKINRFLIYSGLTSTVHCLVPFSNQKSKKYYNEADVRIGVRYQIR